MLAVLSGIISCWCRISRAPDHDRMGSTNQIADFFPKQIHPKKSTNWFESCIGMHYCLMFSLCRWNDGPTSVHFITGLENIAQIFSVQTNGTIVVIIITTSASVKLTQTRHSHSKQLFHEAHILQGFYREGQKVDTCNRKFPFESNRQIVVYSFNIKFLLTAIWDRSQMCRFVRNIARSLLDY